MKKSNLNETMLRLIYILIIVPFSISALGVVCVKAENEDPANCFMPGYIAGMVSCKEQPLPGALVYIPGHSFMARTDSGGEFVLHHLSGGVYDLVITHDSGLFASMRVDNVEVICRQITGVGVIDVCICEGDSDDDGFGDGKHCFGPDCDDNDFNINPAMSEICNGIDDNCAGNIDEGFDQDGDGWTTCADDCNDEDPQVHPGAEELCNDKDDDCNPDTPDVCVERTYYRDQDHDGVGSGGAIKAFHQPEGYSVIDGDCDDTNKDVFPGQKKWFQVPLPWQQWSRRANSFDYDCSGDDEKMPYRQEWSECKCSSSGLIGVACFIGFCNCCPPSSRVAPMGIPCGAVGELSVAAIQSSTGECFEEPGDCPCWVLVGWRGCTIVETRVQYCR